MKWYSINFLHIIILVLAIVLCENFSCAATEGTIEKILANKDSFDGKEVSVSGMVSKPFEGKNEYTTLSLANESKSVWGHSKIKEV